MDDSSIRGISTLLEGQRVFFSSNQTKSIPFRILSLKRLQKAIREFEKPLLNALWEDLHKSPEEGYLTEISIVLQEIEEHLTHLRAWAKPQHVTTPWHLLPSRCQIMLEPLGVALIIAPWNYPFQLLMNPLVGAISAGCCAILKPSPYTPTVARLMEEMICQTFDPGYVAVVQGGRKVNEELLKQRFDLIFFTGSPTLGRVVMRAASVHLTPVALELGGKSPCIVDAGANLDVAAKRIAWGKTLNAGQTCIAPDYLFAHQSIKDQLLPKINFAINRMYAPVIKESRFFPRIVNREAVERLQKLMVHGQIVFGGEVDVASNYIAPTIIDQVQPDFPVMQEEIFGPILPVMTFSDIREVIAFVNRQEKPLAFYYFGKNAEAKDILMKTTSGGACINDAILHSANHHLPFGGVGNSGMGKYHGHESLLVFSNRRSVVQTTTNIDLPFRYAPFRFFTLLKKML